MKKVYQEKKVIGCDETGVSDYLSPLVAAAVFVPINNIQKLNNMGITDSKKISNKKIKKLAEKIKPLIIWRVSHFSQKGYNQLNKSLNGNELKMFLHLKVINMVEKIVEKIDLIIIDQFAQPKIIDRYIEKILSLNFDLKPIESKWKTVINGEMEHIAVATASIIARNKFLDLMDQQNQKWNIKFPLGINKKVEDFIVDFIDKNGIENLKEVAKIKFKTTEKLFGKI